MVKMCLKLRSLIGELEGRFEDFNEMEVLNVDRVEVIYEDDKFKLRLHKGNQEGLMMSKKNHLKGAHEKNYALFCDMMQRGWEMEKIAENLDMKMITVKSYKYLENMNFKINDVKNIEVNEYFAQLL